MYTIIEKTIDVTLNGYIVELDAKLEANVKDYDYAELVDIQIFDESGKDVTEQVSKDRLYEREVERLLEHARQQYCEREYDYEPEYE
jgi:hypothetical protein